MGAERAFRYPTRRHNAAGELRRVGFEIEFSGLSLQAAVGAAGTALDAACVEETAASCTLEAPGLGTFTVELDWDFLKRQAEAVDDGLAADAVQLLSQAAERVVPIEIVCPPLPLDQLDCLPRLTDALRRAGAVGTGESMLAAYGVHINSEAPALDAQTLWHYLRSFALLQWWLVDAHAVDLTRRVSPYVGLYPDAYLKVLFARPPASSSQLMGDYLAHNATRNRALDMLPLFSVIDAATVQDAVPDPRIKARPAFHYRLPNCHIDDPQWSPALSWEGWWVVEELAAREADLDELAAEYGRRQRPLLGVDRAAWTDLLTRWLRDRALA
jgi:hypothetical protein